MTMHLIRGMSSLNTKKRKSKMSAKRLKEVETEWRRYNKDMRRKSMHSCQFEKLEDYISYVSGNLKLKKKEFVPYEPKTTAPVSKQDYPSVSPKSPVHGIPEAGRRKESPKYTGDYIVGIATMHKSNAVPITNREQATEIARMAK